MSSGRAVAFAGKPRKTSFKSQQKKQQKADRDGFKKAFGSLKGYRSKLKSQPKVNNPWQ
jgi:hypothetical protein